LKITGPFYALPAFGLLAGRFPRRWVAVAAITSLTAALLPFVGFSNVSLQNYVMWIRLSAKNGLVFTALRQNVEWAMFILLPLVPTLLVLTPSAAASVARRWAYPGLLVGLTGVAIAASKPGGGSYHLMPFWPVTLYAVALHLDAIVERLRSDALFRSARTVFVLVVASIAGVQQFFFIEATKSMDGIDAVSDLTQFADANPHRSIAMGYTLDHERWTFARPVLVFRGGPYMIDAPAIQEYQLSGLPMPSATIEALQGCEVDLWLTPKGSEPFSGPNRYQGLGDQQLFPDAFKQAFRESYQRTGTTRYFDVWGCRDGARR
jgi:hypothetical protein